MPGGISVDVLKQNSRGGWDADLFVSKRDQYQTADGRWISASSPEAVAALGGGSYNGGFGGGGGGGSDIGSVMGAANRQSITNQQAVLSNTQSAASAALASAGILDAGHVDRITELMTGLFGPGAMEAIYGSGADSLQATTDLINNYVTNQLPGLMSQSAGLAGQAVGVVSDMMKGVLPQDTQDQILRNVAQQFPGMNAERFASLSARSLGLTSLNLTQAGLQAAPTAQAMLQNPGSMAAGAVDMYGAASAQRGNLVNSMQPFTAGLTDLSAMSGNIMAGLNSQLVSPDATLQAGVSLSNAATQAATSRAQIASQEKLTEMQIAESARATNLGASVDLARLKETSRATDLNYGMQGLQLSAQVAQYGAENKYKSTALAAQTTQYGAENAYKSAALVAQTTQYGAENAYKSAALAAETSYNASTLAEKIRQANMGDTLAKSQLTAQIAQYDAENTYKASALTQAQSQYETTLAQSKSEFTRNLAETIRNNNLIDSRADAALEANTDQTYYNYLLQLAGLYTKAT